MIHRRTRCCTVAILALAFVDCAAMPTGLSRAVVDSNRKAPMKLDRAALYPLIVPAGYLPLASPGPIRMGLLDGLEVALVIDHPGEPNKLGVSAGLAQYVRDIDIEAAGLSPKEAYKVALQNLEKAAEKGIIRASGAEGSDGKTKLVIWSDHWLAATCLLLTRLHKMASKALGTEQVVATIPHRDVLVLFADQGQKARVATTKMVHDNEREGRMPITARLLRLLPTSATPFYEHVGLSYVE